MADKETIIDGIDVSGCEHCVKMTKYRCIIQRDVYKYLCEENPNCYFKQLKRKEKECEKYEQALDEIEKYLDAQQKYFDGEDYHNLLDIINKTKGEINEES